MKDLNRVLNEFQPYAHLYRGLYSVPGFRLEEADGKTAYPQYAVDELCAGRPDGVDRLEWRSFAEFLVRGGLDAISEAWVLAGLAAEGSKVYRPSLDEFRALARVELTVPWSVYRQPFDTFVVAVPDGFFPPQSVNFGFPWPSAILCRCDHPARVVSTLVVTDHFQSAKLLGRYSWRPGSEEVIEDVLEGIEAEHMVIPGEVPGWDLIRRGAFNACLLLTQYGARRLGHANPEHAARLQASLARKKVPTAIKTANAAALAAMPVLYGFDQHIRVFDRDDEAATGEGVGSPCRPHWRRGHWANVACGTARAARRLVFRRPVLVNAHRFGGTPADTRVTVTTT